MSEISEMMISLSDFRVYVEGCHLTSEEMRELRKTLQKNPSLKKLVLNGKTIK